jgi:hypothetical protein
MIEGVFSPRQGVLALVRRSLAGGPPVMTDLPFHWAFTATDERIGIYSLRRHRMVSSVTPPSPLFLTVEWTIHPDELPFTGRSTWGFSFGTNREVERGKSRLVQVKFAQSAVAALALAHLPDCRCSWNGEVLTVRYLDRLLRIDAATGRLLEQVIEPQAEAPGWRLATVRGEFERRRATIEAVAADLPNDADERRPLSSVGEFVCEEALALPLVAGNPAEQRPFLTSNKLLRLGLFQPIDEWLARASPPREEKQEFCIPNGHVLDANRDNFSDVVRSYCMIWGLPAGDYLLPRDTWAWRLWREMMFGLAQVGQGSTAIASDSGAFACLAASFSAVLTPDEIWSMTRKGLNRLSLAEFRHDYQALLDQKGHVGRYVRRLVEVVRGLNEEDLQWLEQAAIDADWLEPETAGAFFAVARLLQDSHDPVAETLPRVLDIWWMLGLRKSMESALNRRAGSIPAPYGHVPAVVAMSGSAEPDSTIRRAHAAWRPGGTADFRGNARPPKSPRKSGTSPFSEESNEIPGLAFHFDASRSASPAAGYPQYGVQDSEPTSDGPVFKSSISPFGETSPTQATPPKRLKRVGDRYAPVPTKQSDQP